MGRNTRDWPGWKWAVVGVFCAVLAISGVAGLFTEPPTSAGFFASLAALALGLPFAALAVTHIPFVARWQGGSSEPSNPSVAVLLLGGVSVAFAAGAVGTGIAWLVDGVTEFEISRYHVMMPMAVAFVVFAVVALALGALVVAYLLGKRKRRRR